MGGVLGGAMRFRFPAYARELEAPGVPVHSRATGGNSPGIHGGGLASLPVIRHPPDQERTMSEQKPVRLELTDEQKAQVKAATGKDARAIELNVEELEARIAPTKVKPL